MIYEYNNFTFEIKDKYGVNRRYLNSTKVLQIGKKYFNCYNIKGVELEESNLTPHWESRILLGEIMTDYFYFEEQVISEFTLSFLEDTGLYKANYYTGGLMRFGRNKGCDFLTEKCIENSKINPNFENEFFDTIYSDSYIDPSCSSGRQSRAYFAVWIYNSYIPEYYRYYNNETYGGLAAADFCPVSRIHYMDQKNSFYAGRCSNIGINDYGSRILYSDNNYYRSGQIEEITGETYSSHSFCYLSSLTKKTEAKYNIFSKVVRAICYETFCSSDSLTVKIHENYIVCPRQGGKIEVNGYGGFFLCPDYYLMCSGTVLCNDMFDCVEKKSTIKFNSYYYDYNIKTSQNIERGIDEEPDELNNYELSDNGKCIKNCKQCTENIKCIKCRNNFSLLSLKANNSLICISDNELTIGYYKDSNSIYHECLENCLNCHNGIECDKCKDNFEFKNGECIDKNINSEYITDTNIEINSDSNSDLNSDTNTDIHTYINSDTNSDINTINTYINSDTHSDTNTNINTDIHTYINSDTNTDIHTYINSDTNSDINSNSNIDTFTNSDINTQTNTNKEISSNSNIDINTYINSDTNTETNIDINSDTNKVINSYINTDINSISNTDINSDINTVINGESTINTYINFQTNHETNTNTDKVTYINKDQNNTKNSTNNDIKKIISNNDSSKGISIGLIVGAIAGGIIVIVAIILAIIYREKWCSCIINKKEKTISDKTIDNSNIINKSCENDKIIDVSTKIQVRFEICNFKPKAVAIDGERTMSNLIKGYFDLIGKPELFNRNDSICFLYEANKIDFNCQQKVKDFFGNSIMPRIVVMDTKNLIGSNDNFNQNNYQMIEVIFENMNGNRKNISIEKGKTMKELFDLYFQSNYNLNKDRICFLYNNNIIDSNNKNKIENYFGYLNESPIINVCEI